MKRQSNHICFNPRLTSAARRTSFTFRACLVSVTFQSAPHFSSEANAQDGKGIAPHTKFQSAPHFSSEANAPGSNGSAYPICFNPRLTSAARRTYSPWLSRSRSTFQSAPHFSSEANDSDGLQKYVGIKFQSAPHFSSEANLGFYMGRI